MKTKNLPNNNSVRCINTLLMMIFSLIMIPTVSSAVITFTPAANQMEYFPLSPEAYFSGLRGFEIDYSYNATSPTGEIIAVVHDGKAASIEVTDGTGTLGFFQFRNDLLTSALPPTVFGAPTSSSEFYDCDVTLLRDGTKAIVTFMAAESGTILGAYVVEFDIIALPGFIDVQPSFQLQEPINGNLLTSSPRVDGDIVDPIDPNDDRFAVVSVQDNGINDIYYSLYEPAGSTFQVNTAIQNVLVPQQPASWSSLVRTNPDIALSWEFPTHDPVIAVTYQEYDPFNFTFLGVIVDEHHPISGSSGPVFGSGFPIPFGSYDPVLNGRTRIAGENELTGLNSANMKWSLAVSSANYDALVPHLWYANHTNSSLLFEIDAPFSTNPLIINRDPSLAWMTGTGADDAYLTWYAEISTSPGYQVEGVMTPIAIGFPAFNTWEDVSPWPLGGELTTSAASNPVSNQYVTAFLLSGKIFYKTRSNLTTGF